jgi:hypothetical protein
VPLWDVQEAASHADPRTTIRYDRARTSLDWHATYVVAHSSLEQRGRPGRTAVIGLGADALYGQLLRRMTDRDAGARYAVVVPKGRRPGGPSRLGPGRRRLRIDVYEVDNGSGHSARMKVSADLSS